MENREIDSVVAEKVMGYGTRVKMYQGRPVIDDAYPVAVPHYSTSPDAAWQVVEKMRGDGWGLSITDPFAGMFRLMFTRDPARGEVGVCEVPSGPGVMPLAVCRAALAAMGVGK